MTNERYPHFKQLHFTAGDQEQFLKYRNKTPCLANQSGTNQRIQLRIHLITYLYI